MAYLDMQKLKEGSVYVLEAYDNNRRRYLYMEGDRLVTSFIYGSYSVDMYDMSLFMRDDWKLIPLYKLTDLGRYLVSQKNVEFVCHTEETRKAFKLALNEFYGMEVLLFGGDLPVKSVINYEVETYDISQLVTVSHTPTHVSINVDDLRSVLIKEFTGGAV